MTPPSQQVLNGGTATYTVTVTNTGDAKLDNVTVSNTQTPNCDNVIGAIAPNEVVIYTCDEIITSDVTTTSEVSGDDSTGLAVSDSASVVIEQVGPAIGVAESISGPVVNNGDGTYTLTYEIVVANGGDTQLDAVYLTQDLTSTFAGVTGFTIDAVTSSDLTLNPTFDGSTDTNLLSGSDSLADGGNGAVRVTVTLTPGTELGPHLDQINASATPTIGPDVSDLSDSGTDSDPSGTNPGAPGDSGGSNDPLPVTFSESPSIGIATAVTGNVDNGDGTYTLTYTYTIENDGDVDLANLQVSDVLAGSFADAEGFVLVSVTSSGLSVDPTYDGNTVTNLLDGSDTLTAGSVATIEVVITVTPGAEMAPYTEQAAAQGMSPSLITVSDTSNQGSDPDPGDNGPADDSEPTIVAFTVNYDLQLMKALIDGPDNDRATWRITITNGGTVNSPAFDVEDVLPNQLTFVSASGANTTCSTSGQAVTCHHGGLAAGESVAIDVVTTIFATSGSTIANSATANSLGAAPETMISNNTNSASFTFGHTLAFTGASTLLMIMLALVLVAFGWLLLMASRRRESD